MLETNTPSVLGSLHATNNQQLLVVLLTKHCDIGTALQEQDKMGQLEDCIQLYKDSGFFRALIANGMQNLAKSNFDLTRYMETDERFGDFWKMIYAEHELTLAMVLKVAGQDYLLQDNPRARLSIDLRERVFVAVSAFH